MGLKLENKLGGGLKPLIKDSTEFHFGAIFGYADLKDLPQSYRLGEPLEIKNQYATDLCVAFAIASTREFQEKTKLSPEYIFKNIKYLEGDFRGWGSDPKLGAKAVLNGILEKSETPYSLEQNGRDFVANPENWPASYDKLAEKHKTQGYFWVESHYKIDLFDAIRSALWTFKEEKRALVTGAIWKESWLAGKKGRIPEFYLDKDGTSHAFCVFGWEEENLMLLLSNGKEIGNEGIFYMPRSVANKELLFALMFADYPEDENKESLILKSQFARATFFKKILLGIKLYLKEILK